MKTAMSATWRILTMTLILEVEKSMQSYSHIYFMMMMASCFRAAIFTVMCKTDYVHVRAAQQISVKSTKSSLSVRFYHFYTLLKTNLPGLRLNRSDYTTTSSNDDNTVFSSKTCKNLTESLKVILVHIFSCNSLRSLEYLSKSVFNNCVFNFKKAKRYGFNIADQPNHIKDVVYSIHLLFNTELTWHSTSSLFYITFVCFIPSKSNMDIWYSARFWSQLFIW